MKQIAIQASRRRNWAVDTDAVGDKSKALAPKLLGQALQLAHSAHSPHHQRASWFFSGAEQPRREMHEKRRSDQGSRRVKNGEV